MKILGGQWRCLKKDYIVGCLLCWVLALVCLKAVTVLGLLRGCLDAVAFLEGQTATPELPLGQHILRAPRGEPLAL